MHVADSADALQSFLRFRALDLESSDPVALVHAMIDWYETQRAEDAHPFEDDGDMLVFQWGTHDWGDGPTFEYNITRQFMTGPDEDDDPHIWQLALTAHYAPSETARSIGSSNEWCGSPGDCDDLRVHIASSPGTTHVQSELPTRIEISFEHV